MLSLGPLVFMAPWVLTAFAALPLLYWLLRVMPPLPRRVTFPALRLLAGLVAPRETPQHTPWWLLLLRLLLVAVIILALADPRLNPAEPLGYSGGVLLVVDDGWAAAPHWGKRLEAGAEILDRAGRDGRSVHLLTTAPAIDGRPVPLEGPLRPAEALSRLRAMSPKPWPADRITAAATVKEARTAKRLSGSVAVFWLSDGLGAGPARDLATQLQRLGRLEVWQETAASLPLVVTKAEPGGAELTIAVRRPLYQADEDAGAAPARSPQATEAERRASVQESPPIPGWRGPEEPVTVQLQALARDGRPLARTGLRLEGGSGGGLWTLDLPLELRNQIGRIEILGQRSAGAVLLADEGWSRRSVGLVTEDASREGVPLLAESYYLDRALKPFAALRQGPLAELLARGSAPLSMLILPDGAGLTAADRETLLGWIEAGGLLLRFAGPELAAEQAEGALFSTLPTEEDLIPVRLRRGDRVLGGAMSWAQPARLAPFSDASPFAGLPIPEDVTVSRQVLAEPALDLPLKTWARLADGTPLVTAERRGNGHLVLIHTSANTDWSNLALSGLFVEMLQRLLTLSRGVVPEGEEERMLPPLASLDAYGRLGSPAPQARPLASRRFASARVEPAHPPGYYGQEEARWALNLAPTILAPGQEPAIRPGMSGLQREALRAAANQAPPGFRILSDLPAGVIRRDYDQGTERLLAPWLLLAAVVLFSADCLIGLMLRGLLAARDGVVGKAGRLGGRGEMASGSTRPVGSRSWLGLGLGLMVGSWLGLGLGIGGTVGLPAAPARAQSAPSASSASPTPEATRAASPIDEKKALQATRDTTLAYIQTGIDAVDRVSAAGLQGLVQVLERRTAVAAQEPIGVDPATDELAFYPLIYWPIAETQPPLSPAAIQGLNRFIRIGGLLLIDTRDHGRLAPGLAGLAGGLGPGAAHLREIAPGLDIPPLAPLGPDHVLTKAFYLLQSFPGRLAGGALWLEGSEDVDRDGISAVVLGANDYAAAWAIDGRGQPLYPTYPGGERQREMAYRVGVNLVMYALTGNYKADQVHVPVILERLGQ